MSRRDEKKLSNEFLCLSFDESKSWFAVEEVWFRIHSTFFSIFCLCYNSSHITLHSPPHQEKYVLDPGRCPSGVNGRLEGHFFKHIKLQKIASSRREEEEGGGGDIERTVGNRDRMTQDLGFKIMVR